MGRLTEEIVKSMEHTVCYHLGEMLYDVDKLSNFKLSTREPIRVITMPALVVYDDTNRFYEDYEEHVRNMVFAVDEELTEAFDKNMKYAERKIFISVDLETSIQYVSMYSQKVYISFSYMFAPEEYEDAVNMAEQEGITVQWAYDILRK